MSEEALGYVIIAFSAVMITFGVVVFFYALGKAFGGHPLRLD